MDGRESGNGRAVGSVKVAINKYGGKINQGTNSMKKPHKDPSNSEEKRASKAQELHLAKKKINQINESRKLAESEQSQAELELLKGRKLVRELTSQIEESKSRAKEVYNTKRVEDQPLKGENHRYEEMVGEVEVLKRELSKIKLDMERALEEKSRAEKEADAAGLRLESYMNTAEQLRREIEEANEEEVLVELAQIQARKELAAIEAQRKEEAEKFSFLIEETRKKISVLTDEIQQMKDLEDMLAVTNSDADVLQNELKVIKEMDSRVESSAKLQKSDLFSVTEDLEVARKEFTSVKGGGFHLMSSMDVIRNELKNILEEKSKIEKVEAKTEKSIKNLNSKLLRAKDKLEVVIASEEKVRSMLQNLTIALEKLGSEKEEAEKEKEHVRKETEDIGAEIQKIEPETDTTEEKLQAAMQELEAAKSAEEDALNKLKSLVENAARARASRKKSTITISRFEYDYLTGGAVGAKEIADKKVEAASAWAQALRANEREMKIKTALAERKIKELRLKEEQEVHRTEKSLKAAELAEAELQNQVRQGNKKLQRRGSKKENSCLTPARKAKFRRSACSPATRCVSTSTPLTMKRRRKVMLKLAKYFASRQIENENSVSLEERQ